MYNKKTLKLCKNKCRKLYFFGKNKGGNFVQLVILTFFIHLGVSYLCLSRCKKKTSYLLEILISLFMIASEFCKIGVKMDLVIVYFVLEYICAKFTILCFVIILKIFSFYATKSLVNNGLFSKICIAICGKKYLIKIIANFRKLKYGPRLKFGVPAMAGKKHKATGIVFDGLGFPKFKSFYTFKLKRSEYKKDREYHFYHASKALYNDALKNKSLKCKFTDKELKMFKEGKVPPRFTWHHHQDRGVMLLVDYKVHSKVSHIGGFSIWGKK